jgi:DUF4097 and DUF4098 domain-containing protein YvlB
LVVVEILICLVIVAAVWSSGLTFSRARILYVADTLAQATDVESFDVDGPAVLDLTNVHGDIQIVAGDDDHFSVRATRECWGQSKREAQAKLQALEVEMTMDGDTLRIRVDDPDADTVYLLAIATRSNQVSFEITAPRRTAVLVQTRNGSVSLKGTQGAAELNSHYGSITVEDTSGDIQVETNNGEVTVRRSGDEGATVNLTSHYGDITTQELIAGELTLFSKNGALELEEVTAERDLELDTHYGRIDLDGVRARSLAANSHNGDITLEDGQFEDEVDLYTQYGAVNVSGTEASAYRIETRNGAIKLDGGRGPLQLTSHYGDITVRKAHDATLELVTSNGKVTFEGGLAVKADHQVKSGYGAVSLRLPPDTTFFLDAGTEYGRIRCGFDVLVEGEGEEKEGRSRGDALRGSVNGGGLTLVVNSRNGDIDIQPLPAQ